jgi:hypothetical protein
MHSRAPIHPDLYVMRRAVGVYERIVRRFTAQTTDYQQLLSTFAEGAARAGRGARAGRAARPARWLGWQA